MSYTNFMEDKDKDVSESKRKEHSNINVKGEPLKWNSAAALKKGQDFVSQTSECSFSNNPTFTFCLPVLDLVYGEFDSFHAFWN